AGAASGTMVPGKGGRAGGREAAGGRGAREPRAAPAASIFLASGDGGVVFKRILVPLDLSARNRRTIDTARELARLHGARVTLLHVVQQIPDLAATQPRS